MILERKPPPASAGGRDDVMCAMEQTPHIAGSGACGQEQELVARAHPVGRATPGRAPQSVRAAGLSVASLRAGLLALDFGYGLIDETFGIALAGTGNVHNRESDPFGRHVSRIKTNAQLGPEGGLAARIGAHGSTNPSGRTVTMP
jgi:hypothetical protein